MDRIGMMRQAVSVGARVRIFLVGGGDFTGAVLQYGQDMVVIETDDGQEFLSNEVISRFSVPKPALPEVRTVVPPETLRDPPVLPGATADAGPVVRLSDRPTPPVLETLSSGVGVVPVKAAAGQTTPSEEGHTTRLAQATTEGTRAGQSAGVTPAEPGAGISLDAPNAPVSDWSWPDASGIPYVSVPQITFAAADLPASTLKEFNRWRDIWNYGVRQGEPGRIRQCIVDMEAHAAALRSGDLMTLTGRCADKCGHRDSDRLLRLAVGLGSAEAALALAERLLHRRDWNGGALALRDALLLIEPNNSYLSDIALALARCLNQGASPPPGLAHVVDRPIAPKARERILRMLAVALKDQPRAAAEVLQSNHSAARAIVPLHEVFAAIPHPDRRLNLTLGEAEAAPSQLYPEPSAIEQVKALTPQVDPERLHRPVPRPAFSSPYAEAKRLEQLDRFDEAEELFREAITRNTPQRASAIKDLASLLNRLQRHREALNVLREHRGEFRGDRSVDNIEVNVLMAARRYEEALPVFDRLILSAPNDKSRMLNTQQKAYCLFHMERFDDALRTLDRLGKSSDAQIVQLRKMIGEFRAAKRHTTAVERERGLQLIGLNFELSEFARAQIDACTFPGIDEDIKQRGIFTNKEIKRLDRFIDEIRGRKPREKAPYWLTKAAVLYNDPSLSTEDDPSYALQRFFTHQAEGALLLREPSDTLRFYLSEALSLYRLQKESTYLEMECVLLVASYTDPPPMVDELLFENKYNIHRALACLAADAKGWARFREDFVYFSMVSGHATEFFRRELSKAKLTGGVPVENFLGARPVDEIEVGRAREYERVRTELNELRTLTGLRLLTVDLEKAVVALATRARETRFQLDRVWMGSLRELFELAIRYLSRADWRERRDAQTGCIFGLQRFEDELRRHPTRVSFEALAPIARHLRHLVEQDWKDWEVRSRPQLSLRDVLKDDGYLQDDDGVIRLRLVVVSAPGSAPVENLVLTASPNDGLEQVGECRISGLLSDREQHEVQLRVKPSVQQLYDQTFTVAVNIGYRTHTAEDHVAGPFEIPVRTARGGNFERIDPNPYQAGSSGRPIVESGMFFGRRALIQRVVAGLSSSPPGQCFVLFGQKRSGKSSTMSRIETELKPPLRAVRVSVQDVQAELGLAGLLERILVRFRSRLAKEPAMIDVAWPALQGVREAPVAVFQDTMEEIQRRLVEAEGPDARLVVLIDEFSNIYELMLEKQPGWDVYFMQHWKALLERRLFSAVVAGQTTMQRFMRAYPNEFAVTSIEPINYLDKDEMMELALKPILHQGVSRYRGEALDRLYRLTAGHPFLTQLLCYRLVERINEEVKDPLVSVSDVAAIAVAATQGDKDRLSDTQFDMFTIEAGQLTRIATHEEYLTVLFAIAARSTDRLGAVRLNLPDAPLRDVIIRNLLDRGVLEEDTPSTLRIRVGLFADWLRANPMAAWAPT